MKKVLFLLLILTGSFTAKSQVLISLLLGDKVNSGTIEFGLQGGGNFSSIFNLETKKYVSDWNLGFYFVIKVKNNWYASTGVLVKSKLGAGKLTENDLIALGAQFPDSCTTDEGDYNLKLNTFIVPMMMRYKFKNRLFLEGGLQASLRYKSWVEYDFKSKEKKYMIKHFDKEITNPIDVGVTLGMGYRFNDKPTGMSLNFRYYYGFVNAIKNMPGTKNNSLFLELNIPIGAGEKAQKKREAAKIRKAERKAAKEKKKSN